LSTSSVLGLRNKVVERKQGALSQSLAVFATLSYVHLWIFEGALRKWVPPLATPMYIGRDVLALGLAILLVMASRSLSKAVIKLLILAFVVMVWGLLSSLANGASIALTFAGVRSYLAPLLLVLIVAGFVDQNVTQRVVVAIAAWAPVQGLVTIAQATSEPTSRINLSVGDDSAAFVQYGIARASGTFTSPSGLTLYTVLAIGCALLLVLSPVRRLRMIGVVSSASCLLVATLGGARGTVLGVALVIAFFVLALAARSTGRAFRIVAIGAILLALGAWIITARYGVVLDSFSRRFEDASRSEDSFARLVGQVTRFPDYFNSILGDGPGSHSQAGIALGSNGAWIEDDSSKWVAELGFLGLLLASLRVGLILVCLAYPFFAARVRPLPKVLVVAVLGITQLVGSITQTPSQQATFAVSVALIMLASRADFTDWTLRTAAAPRIRRLSAASTQTGFRSRSGR